MADLSGLTERIPDLQDKIRELEHQLTLKEDAFLYECPTCGFRYHKMHVPVSDEVAICPDCQLRAILKTPRGNPSEIEKLLRRCQEVLLQMGDAMADPDAAGPDPYELDQLVAEIKALVPA